MGDWFLPFLFFIGEYMTLEDLLRMEIKGKNSISGDDISYPPEFRVSIQKKTTDGVHFIIHANGHNSETLDFLVRGNELFPI